MYTRNQRSQAGWIARCIAAVIIIIVCARSATPQGSGSPSLTGQVMDEQGGLIVGARATLTDATGRTSLGATDQDGNFLFADLRPGNYAIEVTADHFRTYRDPRIQVTPGQVINLKVTLRLAGVEESITVFPDTSIPSVAEYIGGSLVIRGDALMGLDGPGGLEAFLRALALRTGSPFGPTILVNGFEDGQVPPTYSIREIRINDNPFSAEYATLGLGRIEMLTKPGSQKFHAETFGMAGDALFNSRNPFSPNKARYESQIFGGNASGPIISKRATFFADVNKQRVYTNAVINATIVDSLGRIVPLRQVVVTPQSNLSASSRFDYQMGRNHTWVLRYADSRTHARNASVGEFSLPSRAVSSNGRVRTFQVTETAVLNARAINETRAQYVRTTTSGFGDNSKPTINVPGAFIGGGADISA